MTTKLTPAKIIRNMQEKLEKDIELLIASFEYDTGISVVNIEGEEYEDGSLKVRIFVSLVDINAAEDEE